MEKIVTAGMRNTTIELDGTECAVTFSANYRCFEVMNDSSGGDVAVSIYNGKTAGEDGVITVHAGMSATVAHMRTDIDTVYITGSGTVQVAAKNSAEPVFKIRSGGGDNKPSSKDYVQEGLIAEWILDGNSDEILTNPLFITDDTLRRTVGKVVDNTGSFFVKKDNLDYADGGGVTLQCLVNIDTAMAQVSSFFAIGVNMSSDTALGIGMDNSGNLLVTSTNDNRTVDYTLSPDVWYHLVVVYKSISSSISLYVNGEKVAVISKGLRISQLMSGAAIGAWVWSSTYPSPSTTNIGNFKIANCCVYERPLSGYEIAENYAVDKKRYNIGG